MINLHSGPDLIGSGVRNVGGSPCAPRRCNCSTWSRWVWSASMVITAPVRLVLVKVSSSGANAVILLVLPSTSTCPSTVRAWWSITASRCRPGRVAPSVSVCREPRRVFPSTASTRRRPAGATAAVRVCTKAPSTVSNRSASTRPISRRMAASDGQRRSTPRTTARSEGRSATHSATATNDRAPAVTAHTAAVRTTVRPWRIPRR